MADLTGRPSSKESATTDGAAVDRPLDFRYTRIDTRSRVGREFWTRRSGVGAVEHALEFRRKRAVVTRRRGQLGTQAALRAN